jgi:hypothetical protein
VDRYILVGLTGLALLVLYANIASAQIQEQLQAYAGRNASGYLGPLVEALGTDLNSGLFHSAHIPRDGFHVGFELALTTVFFGDDDRTFMATTEGDFAPEQSLVAPTVVGPTNIVFAKGDANTKFLFPGGFDVDNFPFAVPQLRVGSWHGTEAVLRFLVFDTGHADLGDLSVYGFGARHSISQYFGDRFPADLALGVLWQSVSLGDNFLGDDLMASDAYSVGVNASRAFGDMTTYTGLAIDWYSMDVTYGFSSDPDDIIELSLESDSAVHFTFGFSYSLAFVDAYGEYNLANQNALSVGLAFQYTSSDRSVGP